MHVVRPISILFSLTIGGLLGAGAAIIGMQIYPDGGYWAGLVPPVVAAVIALRSPLARWRATRKQFPDRWRRWLLKHVPYYDTLCRNRRERFERDVQIFLNEQTIEGVAGVEVTEGHRLAIASAAGMLLNGRPEWEFPQNHSFLIYPANFNEEYRLADEETDGDLLGRAHGQGPVILALPAVRAAIRNPLDGQNVILHELTHLLDFAHLPRVRLGKEPDGLTRQSLEKLLDDEMRRIERGDSLLGSYAGTNPAEFFAVATERFFERSRLLRTEHAALYRILCDVYNQEPDARTPNTGEGAA